MLWIAFVVCTTVIVYSGSRLAKYGDILAEKTGLGRAWIGVVLVASVTSLPELITGIVSVTFAGVPDIAVGTILGSCVFNMLILAFLDAMHRPMPISAKAQQGNVLSAGFGILFLCIIAGSLSLRVPLPPLGWIGLYTLLIIPLYFVAMRLIFFYEKRQLAAFLKETAIEFKYKDIPIKTAVLNYLGNAIVVIVSATFLPKIGEGIAATTGLGQTFVGNIFIAVSTSLPEVVVSIAAVKIGAIDLAIGNIFGSNIFNIFILALDDIFFTKGPILSFVNQNHIISALSAIAMTTIAIIGLTYRAEKKILFIAWDSAGIVTAYALTVMFLFLSR
jgi:cation:H+ antiporter